MTKFSYRTNKEECPNCGEQLQGKAIPEEHQEAYGATHFSQKIGLYSREQDRTVEWRCPFCGHIWPRV